MKQRYKKLYDKEWVKEQYILFDKSIRQISREIGCGNTTVLRAINRFGFKKKENKFESKYKLLNNKNWLYKKYVIEKLGINIICQLAGAKTSNSVRQSLMRFNIPIRSVSDGLTCKRNDDGFIFNNESLSAVEGSLLGDGMLKKWNPNSKVSYPYFRKRNKYYDHILYVAKNIGVNENGINQSNEKLSWDKSRSCDIFTLKTLSHKELMSVYEKWYPSWNNYKKTVPRDLELTPTILLHWFMDDGSSHRRKRAYKNTRQGTNKRQNHNQILIVFCSESFTKEDNEFLSQQMDEKFGIKSSVRPYRDGTGWRIHVHQSSAKRFYDIIGPCPVPSMAYKWKLD